MMLPFKQLAFQADGSLDLRGCGARCHLKQFLRVLLLFLSLPMLPLAAQMNEGETVADAAVAENNAMAPIQETPGLPRVLLIGDSISIAYTLPVRALLKGKANVLRIPVNGEASAKPARITAWLGSGKWDVIHFNFGLWDAKIHGDKPLSDLATYEQNLRVIAGLLKATGARVIFATTTPVPALLKPEGRRFDPIPPYNDVAQKVMKDNGISIDDLYQVILPHETNLQRPFDVHYSPEGSQLLAEAVAASIQAELPAAKPLTGP